jgi:hypothetical protein
MEVSEPHMSMFKVIVEEAVKNPRTKEFLKHVALVSAPTAEAAGVIARRELRLTAVTLTSLTCEPIEFFKVYSSGPV